MVLKEFLCNVCARIYLSSKRRPKETAEYLERSHNNTQKYCLVMKERKNTLQNVNFFSFVKRFSFCRSRAESEKRRQETGVLRPKIKISFSRFRGEKSQNFAFISFASRNLSENFPRRKPPATLDAKKDSILPKVETLNMWCSLEDNLLITVLFRSM